MLSFFRRIRIRLLQQNRFTKYLLYAIGEIVLVVIGILIALYINGKNEEHQDRVEELVALKDLKEEFQSKLNDVDSLLAFKTRMKANWSSYLRTITNADLSDEDRAIRRPQMGSVSFPMSNPTLNSLLSTGKIDKIQNDSLKYVLNNWKDVLDNQKKPEKLHDDFIQSKFLPIELRLLPNAALKNISGTENLFYSEAEIKTLRLKAIENLEYQNALEHSYHLLEVQIRAGKRLKSHVLNVIDLLTNEIQHQEGQN